MKFNKNIKYFCNLFLIALVMSTISLVVFTSPAHSQENDVSVVLVHLMFANERWSVGQNGVLVLPCEGPSKFVGGTESDPLVKVLGEGKVLYQRNIFDPLVILPEDDTLEKNLKEVSFTLPFALVEGMEELEFWYDPLKQQEPSLVVDLRKSIQEYMEKGGPDQEAPCQQPAPTKH